MKNGKDIDLGLTAYDELFMTDQERADIIPSSQVSFI